jgi:hypothetical protein
MKKNILFLSLLVSFFFCSKVFALTTSTTIANCTTQGSITLSSTAGAISSYTYSGTNSGSGTGNVLTLNAGTYSVTATLANGNTETANNIIVEHNDHIQLKNWYLTGNLPSASFNWGATLNDPTMANWTGVIVNGNGCVLELYLSGMGITGSIPNFNLPSLETLYLGDNQLTGSIPNLNLPNLQILWARLNQLSGTLPNFNLPNLKILNFRNNQLTGSIPNFNLPNLENFFLYGNQLTGSIPNFNLPNLKYMYLNDNQLNGTIPNFVAPNLFVLLLNNNQLTGTIPNFNLPSLAEISLNTNQLSGSIPNFTAPVLQYLSLAGNQLSGSIPNFTMPELYTIYLPYNQLTGSIPSFNLPNLTNLILHDNQLSGCIPPSLKTNCISLSSWSGDLRNNPNLSTQSWLDYWNNNTGACVACNAMTLNIAVTGNKVQAVTNAVQPKYLWSNGLTTSSFIALNSGSYSVTVTQSNGCILTANASVTVTTSTINASCSSQGSITIIPNAGTVNSYVFSGTSAGNGTGNIIPLNAGIYNVTATLSNGNTQTATNIIVDHSDHIQLENWYATGNLPNANINWGANIQDPFMNNWTGIVSNSGCVTQINLYDKNISGKIPNFNLPSLQILSLVNNQLSDTIPNFNLSNLKEISLQINQLSGKIPNFNLPNLEVLGLGYNLLFGTIPNFNLPKLKILWLNTNQLYGGIPNFNLPNLEQLSLRDNQISGNIPNFNLPKIVNIRLFGNQLTGNIPNFNLPSLGSIELQNNQLSGAIPNFNLLNLRVLSIHSNQLSGIFPNFNLSNLIVLSIAENQLTGTIPNLNLPKLEVFSISSNQLSGCIPSTLKTNCPLINTVYGGDISNNPNLATQSWADYWNNGIGACTTVPSFSAKVFLNNTDATSLMMDDYMRTIQNFPTSDPYAASPLNTNFTHVNNPTAATITPAIIATTGNNAIIDWVFLELRTGTSGSTSVVYTKAALLQKDGDIVATDGISPVIFPTAPSGNYFVTVRHRNNLGFRTANTIPLNNFVVPLNFTTQSIALFGIDPMTTLSSGYPVMNSGDANSDGSIDSSDSAIWEIQNGSFDNYTLNADYNLDGSIDSIDSAIWQLNNGKYEELE